MLRKSKIWLLSGLAGIGVLGSSAVVALAYNGPYPSSGYFTATVPWNGPWISKHHPASGYYQKEYTDSIGGSYSGDMNGQIVNSKNNNMGSSQTLYDGRYSYYTSNASVDQSIALKLFGDWWVPVDVNVTFKWWS